MHSCFFTLYYVSLFRNRFPFICCDWSALTSRASQYSRGNLRLPLNMLFFFKLVSYSRQVRNKAFSTEGRVSSEANYFHLEEISSSLKAVNRNYGNDMASSTHIWLVQPLSLQLLGLLCIEDSTSLLFSSCQTYSPSLPLSLYLPTLPHDIRRNCWRYGTSYHRQALPSPRIHPRQFKAWPRDSGKCGPRQKSAW